MTTAMSTTVEELLEKVGELEPLIREHAEESEQERRLSPAVAEALRDSGLFRMLRPASRGGLELDPVSCYRVLEAISRIDGSTGWNVQISNSADPFCAWFSDETTEQIFDTQEVVLCGAFNPPRRAVPVDGGYRVSGVTAFNSNCHAATWMSGLANIYDDDGEEPRLGDDGMPITLMTYFPSSEGRIVENWNTLGMRGTGSHDVALDNVFVPEDLACLWAPLEEPGEAYSGPMHRLSIWPALACLCAPALGIAQAAIDDLVELGVKVPAYTERSLRDRNAVQYQLAQAAGKLGAARAFLHATYDEMWELALAGEHLDLPERARCQLAITQAVVASAEAVDHVYACVGASGIREEQNFQKYFRDIHVITQHAFACASRLESVGQVMLGVEPEWGFFNF